MDDKKLLENYYDEQLELEKKQKELMKHRELRRRKLVKKNERGQWVPIEISDDDFDTLKSKPHIQLRETYDSYQLLTGIFSATAVFSLLIGMLVGFEAISLNFPIGLVLASLGLILFTILLTALAIATDFIGKSKK